MNEIKELSEEQFSKTMGNNMNNVTKSAEAVVDIWNYAKQLLEYNYISDYVLKKRIIEAVYENSESTYQHILLFSNKNNIYIVIVVDIIYKTIYGHYFLNLNEEYGLDS